ncbi:hypothetical protein WJR50_12620 [Catalinimonas sp. 4WD22]|uniref:hypothetical protein n=1 Tax=Catalinimonas locisalis TaxID=3133978 RepID=UPI003100C036
MKLFTLIIGTMLAFSLCLKAENGYQEAMKKGIAELENADSPEAMNRSANFFERIAATESNQWLPAYYAAYARINLGAMEGSDEQLDLAQAHLDKIAAQEHEKSEVVALQGYLYTIRVALDPANRGPQLAPQAIQTLSEAVQMNPKNPRALMLLAQMQYGTAQFFKSDTQEACQMVDQAVLLFEKTQPSDALWPNWGKNTAENIQQQCANTDAHKK